MSDQIYWKWHALGDSHVAAFHHAANAMLLQKPLEITLVHAATAVGLRNPNQALRGEAEARELLFIDIAASLLDPDTGVVSEEFRHPNPKDHHLHPEKSARLWASALNGLTSRIEGILLEISRRTRGGVGINSPAGKLDNDSH